VGVELAGEFAARTGAWYLDTEDVKVSSGLLLSRFPRGLLLLGGPQLPIDTPQLLARTFDREHPPDACADGVPRRLPGRDLATQRAGIGDAPVETLAAPEPRSRSPPC
jgi:hypothetical protein